MYLEVRELVQLISKITYVNWVANKHVLTNHMHIGHTRYTSTLLNIKIQYAHDFLSVLHFIKKMFMITLFAQEIVCGVFRQWYFVLSIY